MLEFMKDSKVNDYNLYSRIKDCEPNLLSFNYITPMAICLEAMLKIAYSDYAKEKNLRITVDDIDGKDSDNYTLGKLIKKDDVRAEKFLAWFKENYEVSDYLISCIRGVNQENNIFKHSLKNAQRRGPSQRKDYYKTLYQVSAKYFKHKYKDEKDKKEAPPWSDDEFDLMMKGEKESVQRRGANL